MVGVEIFTMPVVPPVGVMLMDMSAEKVSVVLVSVEVRLKPEYVTEPTAELLAVNEVPVMLAESVVPLYVKLMVMLPLRPITKGVAGAVSVMLKLP